MRIARAHKPSILKMSPGKSVSTINSISLSHDCYAKPLLAHPFTSRRSGWSCCRSMWVSSDEKRHDLSSPVCPLAAASCSGLAGSLLLMGRWGFAQPKTGDIVFQTDFEGAGTLRAWGAEQNQNVRRARDSRARNPCRWAKKKRTILPRAWSRRCLSQ